MSQTDEPTSPLPYASLDVPRSVSVWRSLASAAALTVAVVVLVCGLFIAGFFAWFYYVTERNAVELDLTNRSAHTVDAEIFDRDTRRPVVRITGQPAGTVDDDQTNAWRDLPDAVLRVRVGASNYETYAGILLTDDGPHRFRITAFDDRVQVTQQSNEGPSTFDMDRVAPTP